MQTERTSFRLNDKVALITGSGRGIGAETAEVLAEAGAKVVVTDIIEEESKAVAERINSNGGEAIYFPLDVTSEDQWESVVQNTVQKFGGLNILVNNAAIVSMNQLEDTSLEEWRKIMNVNSDGVFLGIKHAILAMKPGGISGQGGSIINISSVCAMIVMPGSCAYSAAKAAVRITTKMAAVECGRSGYGIRVNSVHPGVIRTEMMVKGLDAAVEEGIYNSREEAESMFTELHPIGRLGDSLDVAQAVLYLASDASAFVTGAELVVDGGYLAV
jgi:NAD(P)-dependent dehydrogenase (short-subunit alcohol dehydrogenase family)